MTQKPYTRKELAAFRYLVELGESQRQMDRIESRLEMKVFVEKHGKEKCDLMFEELKKEQTT